ncbi:MAG: glycosyltransferase, partial [Burkholderiaceae bacterium]|nr:glycosyltransferase [Burkholderiaceae bacterium]
MSRTLDQPVFNQYSTCNPHAINMTSPKVCVIIVNWNGGDFLQRCLADLHRQTLPPHEIIVLDNASTDGSAQKVAA